MVANIHQGLLILYFISSSSLPTPNLPSTPGSGTKWSGDEKQSDQKGTDNVSSVAYEGAKVSQPPTTPKPDIELPPATASGERMNATFVTLARNSDLWDISRSIRQVEDRFNRQYNYDWVFLNDKPFDETFKKVTTSLVSGKTHYGQIPEEHWSFPSFIDQDKAKKVREDMAQRKIIYGDSISYRHMCRFESGFFFRHELMNNFEYYWRVEPSIELFCDIHYDPFKFMKDNGKKYSFVLSLYEYVETIPTLWDSVVSFMKKHPEHISEDNSMGFLSDDDGKTYNHCHFVSWSLLFPMATNSNQWSNFEIGNLNWLRSQAYIDFFDSLDHDGGFFYERWGDAPVHSIAAGLMLKKDEIHFFNDIAYYHVPFTHCPTGDDLREKLKCHCNPNDNFDWKGYSCE
jgi:alpha 1,2-mannosyltransferase